MDGVVVVDKPGGLTSHDAVARLRRLYGTKRVGHAGTLDPIATGVLVACLGRATRIAEYLAAATKEYEATAIFGVATDSQDITGSVIRRANAGSLGASDIESALPRFRGAILQVPPMVSAVHHEGRRLYELARQGVEVERSARPVHVSHMEMTSFQPGANPEVAFSIECSTGTYIRTLIADIGDALGVGAAMASLRRTRAGTFTAEQAYTLDELAERSAAGVLAGTLRPIRDALADWPQIVVTETAADEIRHGRAVDSPAAVGSTSGRVLLLDAAGGAVALARFAADGGLLAPFKVLT